VIINGILEVEFHDVLTSVVCQKLKNFIV